MCAFGYSNVILCLEYNYNNKIFTFSGYGVYIKSAVGRTLINMTDVEYNWGDGIKMYISNYTINEFNRDYPMDRSFCIVPSVRDPSFPILIFQDLIGPTGEKDVVGTECNRVCNTKITIHKHWFHISLHF